MKKVLVVSLILAGVFAAFSLDAVEIWRRTIAVEGLQHELNLAASQGFLTRPGPRTGMWKDFPNLNTAEPVAYGFFEDFIMLPSVDNSPYKLIGWYAYGDSTDAQELVPVADVTGGAIAFQNIKHTANAGEIVKLTDRNQASSEPFKINSGNMKPLWFVAKFRIVSNDSISFAFGLARKSATWDSIFTDTTGALACTFIGFKTDMVVPGSSPDSLQFSYKYDGNAAGEQTIGVIDANTWYTVGFYFDGADKVYPYLNGTVGSAVDTDLTGFPDENLTVAIASKKIGLTNRSIQFDWIKAYQVQ